MEARVEPSVIVGKTLISFHPIEFPSNHMPAVTLGNSMVYYEAEELNPARRIKPLECPAFIRVYSSSCFLFSSNAFVCNR